MGVQDTVIFWQPTHRTRLFLCQDGEHIRWTPHLPDAKDTQYKAAKFTLAGARKMLRRFTGRLYLGVI